MYLHKYNRDEPIPTTTNNNNSTNERDVSQYWPFEK